jgi:thioester reductase-like protein
MNYFVTGATGFIGRRLVEKLLQRRTATVYYLILERELPMVETLRQRWGQHADRTTPIIGDLTQPRLGVSDPTSPGSRAASITCFHLAAIYDLKASAEIQEQVNIEGTRNVVAVRRGDRSRLLPPDQLHRRRRPVRRRVPRGYVRRSRELDHPYYRTKHESEGIVRRECSRPWRVYRPGIVVGDSRTGEMDKIDGPYYFFKLIQKAAQALPPWMPMIGIEGGR